MGCCRRPEVSFPLMFCLSVLVFSEGLKAAQSNSDRDNVTCSKFSTYGLKVNQMDSPCLSGTSAYNATCLFECAPVEIESENSTNQTLVFKPTAEARCGLNASWDRQVCEVNTTEIEFDVDFYIPLVIFTSKTGDEILNNPNSEEALIYTISVLGNVSKNRVQNVTLKNEDPYSFVLSFSIEFSTDSRMAASLNAAYVSNDLFEALQSAGNITTQTEFMETLYHKIEDLEETPARSVDMVVALGNPFLSTAQHRELTNIQAIELADKITNETAVDGNYTATVYDPWFAIIDPATHSIEKVPFSLVHAFGNGDVLTTHYDFPIPPSDGNSGQPSVDHSDTILIVIVVAAVILLIMMVAVAYCRVLSLRRKREYNAKMESMQLQTLMLQQRNGEALFTTVTAGVAQWLTDVANGHIGKNMPMWCIPLGKLTVEKQIWPNPDAQGGDPTSSRTLSALSREVGNMADGGDGAAEGGAPIGAASEREADPSALCHESYEAKLLLQGSTESFEVAVRVTDIVPANDAVIDDTRLRWEGLKKLVGVQPHSAQFQEGTKGRVKDEGTTTRDKTGGQGKEDPQNAADPRLFHQGVIAELQDLSLHRHMRLFIGCGAIDEINWFYVLEKSSGAQSLDKLAWKDVQEDKPWTADDLPSWEQRLQWLVDITSALSHMHQRGFVHANLRSTGVMISHDNLLGNANTGTSDIDVKIAGGEPPRARLRHAKVGEPFMLSQLHVHTNVNSTWAQSLQHSSAFLWMAPELLLHAAASRAATSQGETSTRDVKLLATAIAIEAKEQVTVPAQQQASGYDLWKQQKLQDDAGDTSAASLVGRDCETRGHGLDGGLLPGLDGQTKAVAMPVRSPPEDIFALATIAHELLCMTSPWRWARMNHRVQYVFNARNFEQDLTEERTRIEHGVTHGMRMPIPSDTLALAPPRYKKFLKSCWRQRPSSRPRIKRVTDLLADMVESLKAPSGPDSPLRSHSMLNRKGSDHQGDMGHSLYFHHGLRNRINSSSRWSLLGRNK